MTKGSARKAKAPKAEPTGIERSRSKPRTPKKTFADAVNAAPPPVAAALQPGKQALKKSHRALVVCKDEARWTGSIELDAALTPDPAHASEHRWDYGLGYQDPEGRESALWVEVHSAETSEVSTVIKKLRWLKDYLRASCPDLSALTDATPERVRFVWVASGRYAIPAHMPQLRALRAEGLDPPVPRLLLP